VRTVRVTVLLTEREHATLLRACGGRGVATLLASAGLREAEAMASPAGLAARLLDGATPERLAWLADVGEALTVTSGQRVGKSEATRKLVAKAKAAGVSVEEVKR
jgi:hypothetical protein